jgi:hypothetical protein
VQEIPKEEQISVPRFNSLIAQITKIVAEYPKDMREVALEWTDFAVVWRSLVKRPE